MLTGSVLATGKDYQKGSDPEDYIQEGPDLGQPATAEEVAALSINVFLMAEAYQKVLVVCRKAHQSINQGVLSVMVRMDWEIVQNHWQVLKWV